MRLRASRVPSQPDEPSSPTRVSDADLSSFEGALSRGPSALSDEALVSLFLHSRDFAPSARGRAARLLEEVGGLAGLARAAPGGLRTELDLDEASAVRLCAAFELGRRAAVEDAERRLGTRMSAEAVARWAAPRLVGLDHEEVWVLCLDGRSGLLGARQVARGGVHGCALLPRDVLIPIVREAASAFVLVHNHPSGDPTPSQEDREMTRALAAAAETLSIPLLDHVIVAQGGYRSMLEMGLFDACSWPRP